MHHSSKNPARRTIRATHIPRWRGGRSRCGNERLLRRLLFAETGSDAWAYGVRTVMMRGNNDRKMSKRRQNVKTLRRNRASSAGPDIRECAAPLLLLRRRRRGRGGCENGGDPLPPLHRCGALSAVFASPPSLLPAHHPALLFCRRRTGPGGSAAYREPTAPLDGSVTSAGRSPVFRPPRRRSAGSTG